MGMEWRLVVVALVSVFFGLKCRAASPACQAILEAVTKVYTTPVHLYTSSATSGGKTSSSETIYANHSTYVLVNGQWRANPVNPEDIKTMKKRAEADTSTTCAVVREEPVEGESAILYSRHATNNDTTIDSRLWVSKANGLPLKQVIDMDAGASGKNHQSVRYDYTNVHAPDTH
jgi:hypothetical protein